MLRSVKIYAKYGERFTQGILTVVKDISQDLPPLGESGSKVSHFISELRNSAEVTKLSDYIEKPWLKTTLKDIKNLLNNQTFLAEDQKKVNL